MEYSPQYDYQPRRKSVPEVLIENILISIVAVFIIVLGFLMVAMSMSTIDTSYDYKSYEFTIAVNPSMAVGGAFGATPFYTSNPLLINLVVQEWKVGGAVNTIPPAKYTYDGDDTTVTIDNGEWISSDYVRISADIDVATAPYETFFSVCGIGLIIGSIATIFGLIGYAYYKNG
jgi:hypothetical protein